MAHHTHLSTEMLDLNFAYQSIIAPRYGAVNTFIGIVRDNHEGNKVTGITYDAHPILAKKCFDDICQEASQHWLDANFFIAHYQGYLAVGKISLIIAVATRHRQDSFAACRFLIEEIKKRAPIWKKEHYLDKESQWLPGHSLNVK